MQSLIINRYGLNEPSKFVTIGLMVLGVHTAIFSGEDTHTFNGRAGTFDTPVDVTPFLEGVQVLEL